MEGGSQAFGDVDDGIDEYADLQPLDAGESRPGIVDATQKGDGHDDYSEDEADLFRLHKRADGEAERTGQQTGENKHGDQKPPAGNVGDHRRAGNEVGQGKDNGSREDALDGGEDDLLDGHRAD